MWSSIKKTVLNIVLTFVLRQIDKFKGAIDWAKVKADMDARIKKIFPIAWITPAVLAIADTALDDIQKILSAPEDLKKISDLCAAGKWDEALTTLRDLLVKVWGASSDPAHISALAALK